MSEPQRGALSTPRDPAGPGSAGTPLVAGLLDEQSRAWRRGEGVPAEAYRERHPALQSDPEGLLDLIDHEVVLRQERGEAPRLEEYLGRFPQHAEQLRKLFDLDAALEAGPPAQPERTVIPSAGAAGSPAGGGPAGRYELLGEIGRGGVGAVLRGRDRALGRELAVKVLLGEHHHDPEARRRFLEEAQVGSQLQHPGVVPVHGLGRFEDGRPYFTMKLVEGQTLAELLQRRRDPADRLPRFLGIFEQVCQTVAYAHSQGVVHRDLKPANVMVDAFGEVQVMDWGLAKRLPAGRPARRRAGTRARGRPRRRARGGCRRERGRCWGRWPTWPRSRRGARSGCWTSAATCSAWGPPSADALPTWMGCAGPRERPSALFADWPADAAAGEDADPPLIRGRRRQKRTPRARHPGRSPHVSPRLAAGRSRPAHPGRQARTGT